MTVLPLLLAAAFSAPEVAPPPRAVVLTSAAAVRRLAPDAAAARLPVRLTAVVTHVHPTRRDFFVQNETGALYVHPTALSAGLKVGDQIVLDAVTDPGAFSPCLKATAVSRLGTAPLPRAVPHALDLDETRWLDAQRVSVRAVVESVQKRSGFAILRIATARGVADVACPEGVAEVAQPLVGRVVTVEGVLAAGFDVNRAVVRPPTIYCPGLPLARLAAPGAGPMVVRRIADVMGTFLPQDDAAVRWVRFAGTVTAAAGSGEVYVQDESGGLLVIPRPSGDTAIPSPGTRVEATGFLEVRGRRIAVARAGLRVLDPGSDPTPVAVPAYELVDGRWDGRLVSVEGRVGPEEAGSGSFEVRNGATPFAVALVHGAHAAPPPGALVRVTGVPSNRHPGGPAGGSVVVWVRRPADVDVLETPPPPPPEPWWTPARVGGLIAGCGGLAVVAFGWIILLRIRVRRQTDRIRTQSVQESVLEAGYRDLFENARDAVWVTGPEGRLVALNRAAERLLGVAAAGAIGRPIAEFLDAADAGSARESFVARTTGPFEMTVVPRSGAPVRVEVASSALPNGGVQTTARDVTARVKLQEQARRVEKLEALGRLAGGIAHDFNNLLTVINGYAELLLDRSPRGSPDHALATGVLDAGTRAAGLTRKLLTFSRQRFIAPTVVELSLTAEASVELLRRLVGARVSVVTAFAADTPAVAAEAGAIDQILINLAVNARDAMPAGGTLTIRTDRAPDGSARLTVADTGCGMPPDVQARVFEPFFTTKPVGQGTGLGLATVYGVVQAMGGTVRFKSAVGHGTTFEILLPAAAPPPPAVVADNSELVPPSEGATVLLVEDDDGVRHLLKKVLEKAGYRVAEAADGPAALAVAADLAGLVDVVVSDVRMPGMSGRELADRLLADRPGLRGVLVSGYVGDEFAADLPAGWAFLPKPFAPAVLVAKVRAVLTATASEQEVPAGSSAG